MIWRLPSWLYAEPPKANNAARGTVAPDKWPELCECIGTYLLYAKNQYAVEPDLLCLNWPNIGTSILLSPEEYAYVVKGIGDYLQRLGLPPRMVLGELSEPRSTLAYVTPASEDPEAVAQVGAVGIHTWGGASAEQYAAWADLARRLDVPLLVTALGVDPDAWADHAFEAYGYALREAKTYQEVLLSARPRGALQWEFSGDYPLLQAGGAPDGSLLLKPTARYSFVRHFCNLTPYDSEALATTSDNDKVLLTAFRGQEEQQGQFTVHILNNGPAREATLAGVPVEIGSLRAVVTNGDQWFVDQEPVTVGEGTAKLNLKPASLLTLTTIEGG